MRSRTILARAAVAIGLIATGAVAATPAEQIAARQQNFKGMGRAFKNVNDELKKETPSLAIVRPYSAALARFGTQLPGWFPAGTSLQTGIKTGAKPEIWTDRAGFARAANNLRTASANLARVSRGNDVAAISAAARALGGACKGCHDSFRAKTD